MKVDNTMLMAFQKCPLYYKTRIEDWWTSRFASGALGHGGAVHEGLKVWYQGMKDGLPPLVRAQAALEAVNSSWPENHPIDDFRTKAKALELLVEYFKLYPQETFQILQVEVPFTFELDRFILHCKNCDWTNPPHIGTSGLPRSGCQSCGQELEPIEYGGIFDVLTQFGGGSQSILYILEHKTTSMLGATYFLQWEIHNQVIGYCWGAQQVSGKLIGGANLNSLCLTRGGNIKFERRLIGVSQSLIDEWRTDVAATCNEIDLARRTGHWRKSTEQCVGKYGPCQFHSVHTLVHPDERRRRLEADYVKQEWNFEKRDDAVPLSDAV